MVHKLQALSRQASVRLPLDAVSSPFLIGELIICANGPDFYWGAVLHYVLVVDWRAIDAPKRTGICSNAVFSHSFLAFLPLTVPQDHIRGSAIIANKDC